MQGRAGGGRARGRRRRARSSCSSCSSPGCSCPSPPVPRWAARRAARCEGPATAALPDASSRRSPTNPKSFLPVTYTDVTGKPVTIEDTRRILALDSYGTLASTVYALGLGDRLVGRDVSTGIPSLQHLPLVTHNGHELNAEAILDLRPERDAHRLLDRSARGAAPAPRRRHPDRDHERPPLRADDRPADPGGRRRARRARPSGSSSSPRVDQRRRRAAEARDRRLAPPDPKQRLRMVFLYMRGNAGVYYWFGKGSGADDLIDGLDGVDVATEAGLRACVRSTPRGSCKADPDLYLMMTLGLKSVGGVDGLLEVPGVADTTRRCAPCVVDMTRRPDPQLRPAVSRRRSTRSPTAIYSKAAPAMRPRRDARPCPRGRSTRGADRRRRPTRVRTRCRPCARGAPCCSSPGSSSRSSVMALVSAGSRAAARRAGRGARLGAAPARPRLGHCRSHPRGEAALWDVRFPRVAMAMLVGAALGAAGALHAGRLRQPARRAGGDRRLGRRRGRRVRRDRVRAGRSSAYTTAAAAFVTALLTTMLVYTLSRSDGPHRGRDARAHGHRGQRLGRGHHRLLVFLGDTAAASRSCSGSSAASTAAAGRQVRDRRAAGRSSVSSARCCIARTLDLLALGERAARHLGVDVERLRLVAIVVVALLVAAGVAFAGIIAFVGLVVPHLVRMVIGPVAPHPGARERARRRARARPSPTSSPRTAVDYADLPIGMLTALVGGPFFFWLLLRTRAQAGGWA